MPLLEAIVTCFANRARTLRVAVTTACALGHHNRRRCRCRYNHTACCRHRREGDRRTNERRQQKQEGGASHDLVALAHRILFSETKLRRPAPPTAATRLAATPGCLSRAVPRSSCDRDALA